MIMKKVKEWLAAAGRILKAHHAPHEVALGVAIGCFISILPLYGLHTVLCIVAALLIPRANKWAILLGSSASTPLTIAPITWTAYDIGRFLLADKNYPPLSWEYIKNFEIAKISEFYYPLFVGSVVLGLCCAGIAFFITWAIASYLNKKRHPEG